MYNLALGHVPALGVDPETHEPPAKVQEWVVYTTVAVCLGVLALITWASATPAQPQQRGLGAARRRPSPSERHGYDVTTGAGQKRLMYESAGFDISRCPANPAWYAPGEWGHDPILDTAGNPTGKVRMVPTGRVVDLVTVRR